MKARRSERGQALVLIVLAIGAIFGFAALAIDVGQIYSVRRKAQNAADAAALAAAYDAVQGSLDRGTAVSKGFSIAALNGFNTDGETNWVVVNNPPIGGPYCFPCTQDPVKYEYYQVKITVRTSSIFAQMLFKGAEQTTVEAVAHSKPPDTVSSGDAIHSLGKEDKALDFTGDMKVTLYGGNIRSNGGLDKNGGSGKVGVEDPGQVFYATEPPQTLTGLDPKPIKDSAQSVGSFKPPACPTAAEAASWPKVDLGKGQYYYKNTFAYKDEKPVDYYYYPDGLNVQDLPPGMHCIDGGIPKGTYSGVDILIVLLSGGIEQTGNDSMDLRRAGDLIDREGSQWGGMLLYAPPTNTNTIEFGGNFGQSGENGEAYLMGTVYAPGATCDVGGTADGREEHTAIICYAIKFHGNAHLNIFYNPAELFHFPAINELVQ